PIDPARDARGAPEGGRGGTRGARGGVHRGRRPSRGRQGDGVARRNGRGACRATAQDWRWDRLGRVRPRTPGPGRTPAERTPFRRRRTVRPGLGSRVPPDPRRPRVARRVDVRPAVDGRRDRVRRYGSLGLPLRCLMTWAALVHVVISGLATGSIYALMAL